MPNHQVNLYYTGKVSNFGIDFNADYTFRKQRNCNQQLELSEKDLDRDVNTENLTRSNLFAEKLIVSYPLLKGQIEVGEEYTNTRWESNFNNPEGYIANYCCPLNMIDLSELVVFPTSSDDLRLSKPSCACALVLFFGSYCVWRAFYHGGQRFLPVFLRVLQEPLYVDIVHQHDSHYRGQP